jgi:hypothetical protein
MDVKKIIEEAIRICDIHDASRLYSYNKLSSIVNCRQLVWAYLQAHCMTTKAIAESTFVQNRTTVRHGAMQFKARCELYELERDQWRQLVEAMCQADCPARRDLNFKTT